MTRAADHPLAWLSGLEFFGIKLGLHNISVLLESLGHPERAFTVIHVGGTNGKGSVTAMADSALRAAGLRSARYTSPHLVDLTERFVVDGHPVDSQFLAAVVDDVRSRVADLQARGELSHPPTFFEATTAAAFEVFRRHKVNIAVCEVGLGGRLDATNVVRPLVTAITSIGLDHQQHLGSTIEAIAAEKAGIIKPTVPVVVGPMAPEARAIITAQARERDAPVIDAWHGVLASPVNPQSAIGQSTRLRVLTPRSDYGEIALALSGPHQIDNAVVAIRTLEAVSDKIRAVTTASIKRGLSEVVWPGRLDLRRLGHGREVLLDAAHNPDGASALAQALADDRSWSRPPLVFAVMQDKDAAAMLRVLLPVVGPVICTRASSTRAMDPDALATLIRTLAPDHAWTVEPTPADALRSAWRLAPRVVVAGSMFLIGDVIKVLETP